MNGLRLLVDEFFLQKRLYTMPTKFQIFHINFRKIRVSPQFPLIYLNSSFKKLFLRLFTGERGEPGSDILYGDMGPDGDGGLFGLPGDKGL